jgi:hypothetical protein
MWGLDRFYPGDLVLCTHSDAHLYQKGLVYLIATHPRTGDRCVSFEGMHYSGTFGKFELVESEVVDVEELL